MQPKEDSCLLAAPVTALGLGHHAGTSHVQFASASSGLAVVSCCSPLLSCRPFCWGKKPGFKRQKVLCLGGEGSSWLPGMFHWVFSHEAWERYQTRPPSEAPFCSDNGQHGTPSEAAVPLLLPLGLHRAQMPLERQGISWLCCVLKQCSWRAEELGFVHFVSWPASLLCLQTALKKAEGNGKESK